MILESAALFQIKRVERPVLSALFPRHVLRLKKQTQQGKNTRKSLLTRSERIGFLLYAIAELPIWSVSNGSSIFFIIARWRTSVKMRSHWLFSRSLDAMTDRNQEAILGRTYYLLSLRMNQGNCRRRDRSCENTSESRL